MKLNRFWTLLLLMGVLAASCIQDEPLNAEADIESCEVISPADCTSNVQVENSRVLIYVKPGTDITRMQLSFTLTPGATIEPDDGTIRDFTTPKSYTVTSEDRKWKKEYLVTVTTDQYSVPTRFDFEKADVYEGKYYVFYEEADDGTKLNVWASGNGGYSIVAFGKSPDAYPTIISNQGRSGKCAKLETMNTELGISMGMPIAAGNLFLGTFIPTHAVLRPLEATQFGVDFNFVPLAVTGYYKYKPGPVFTEKDGSVNASARDSFDIYAIVYEPDDANPYLNGTNQLSSPRLVMVARIIEEERKETDSWTRFYIPFHLQPGKELDLGKLATGQYKLSVVFSASIYGDLFRGAAGSTLYVDDVEILTDNPNE